MNIDKEILPDNPAARLMSTLEKICNQEYTSSEISNQVWARTFNVSTEPEELLTHYAQLFTLIKDSYDIVIEYYPKQQKTHQDWKNYLTNLFKRHSPYNHHWNDMVGSLKKGSYLDMVQIASDNLSHYVAPTKINDLSAENLKKQIEELISDIDYSSQFTTFLKEHLKEEFNRILEYIKHFDLYGSIPIRKSIYNILSNNELAKNQTSKVVKTIGGILVCIATAIGVVNDTAEFPDSIEHLKKEFLISYKSNTSASDENEQRDIEVN